VKFHAAASGVTVPGEPEHFTGTAWRVPIFEAGAPTETNLHNVIFEPGARTHWHSHPGGQTIFVLGGRGRIQSQGTMLQRIAVGDAIYVPPGERHWHGADPDSFLLHLVVTIGRSTDWEEIPVGSETYAGSPTGGEEPH
jgi:quercetin dioxygenase-like cupin family protein